MFISNTTKISHSVCDTINKYIFIPLWSDERNQNQKHVCARTHAHAHAQAHLRTVS